MTEDIRKALLDLRARQESGEHMPCPRCGRDTMYENLYTNALSREADGIYVCSDCGSNESVLSFMNNPLPVDDWAIFIPDKHDMDFKDIPGEQAWEQIQKEQTRILQELYVRWLSEKAGADFKPYRKEALRRCPGLSFLYNSPFSAVYKVAEGELVLRFKSTAKGVRISKDILRFSK
jgi:hypothetical protein